MRTSISRRWLRTSRKLKIPSKNPTGRVGPEDAALFRTTVGKIVPLIDQNRVNTQNRPRKPVMVSTAASMEVPDTLSDHGAQDAPTEFLKNGLSRMVLRKLRRGVWRVEDSLDLHGNNRDAARILLQEFLHQATRREFRCVLVIHGKGINNGQGEAVLRKLTRHWLAQHPRVMVFCDAPPRQGGSGAALVLLSGSSQKSDLFSTAPLRK